jgi:protein phosphatase
MNYQVSTLSEIGNFRTKNEDAIAYGFNDKLNITWMIIADGMGGHLAGEVASGLLIDYLKQQIVQLETKSESDWCRWIAQQITSANEIIFEYAQKQDEFKGMGTTGVVLIFDKQQCSIGWVGDSRAYLLRDNQLSLQTEDHTMIQYLLNKGAITANEAEKSNTKNLLSRAIGSKQGVVVDTISYRAVKGDTVMLSTDGLHDYLTPTEITEHMKEFASLSYANVAHEVEGISLCKKMTEQAIAQLSKDNLTLGLISIIE